jgi:hypothetical protein
MLCLRQGELQHEHGIHFSSRPDCFNSGVFVFKPSHETFHALVNLAQTEGSFDGVCPCRCVWPGLGRVVKPVMQSFTKRLKGAGPNGVLGPFKLCTCTVE